jgi:hypothetical protein
MREAADWEKDDQEKGMQQRMLKRWPEIGNLTDERRCCEEQHRNLGKHVQHIRYSGSDPVR